MTYPWGDDARLVVSVSGGKDSTAACLHLRELGYGPDDYDRIFMDTGWESPRSYEYLRDVLPEVIGDITWLQAKVELEGEAEALSLSYEERLGFYSPMVRLVIKKGMFPSRMVRWCTRALKLKPSKAYIAEMEDEPVNVVGIRAEESARRASMPEHDWSDTLRCAVWRPLINWTFEDVAAIHRRHGVRPNPLYFSGADRVGCYPCIYARKSEIRHFVDTNDSRLGIIRDLEQDVARLSRARHKAQGKPHNFDPTWFQCRTGNDPFWPIDHVARWSLTKRGGRQYELFGPPPDAGCMRWGMCDTGQK